MEQGRWSVSGSGGGGTTGFGARGTFAAPALRSTVLERKSQREVWAEVDRYSARVAAPSATGSYQAIFQDASLFTREWPKLLSAHAGEAYGRRVPEGDERALRARIEELLKKSAAAEGSLRRNAGAGRRFEFRVDRARGAALVAEGQVVHAAIL